MQNNSSILALFILIFSVQVCIPVVAQKKSNMKDQTPNEVRAKKILSKLSLEDKCGEMTQLAIDVTLNGEPYNPVEPQSFDMEKLREVLIDLRVGSILNVAAHAYTRERWYEVMDTIQTIATKEKKNSIPVLYGIDAIHGANYTVGATLMPQQIGLAATWNPELARLSGEVSAYETRASAIPWTFSPVLDMGRDQRWPRLWETFGEDVHLASEMGVAMIDGFQGDDIGDKYHVAACMKHFLGYSIPWSGKDRSPAYIPERQLREYFVPTFQKATDAGAATLMICSGEVNGIPVHANPALLKDLLRTEMGFKGLAVSDWDDLIYLVNRHRVATDMKDAIRIAVNAGMDMAMVPMDTQFPILLKELVQEGKVPMERIDEAVTRILIAKIELGLFEQPFYPMSDYPDFASEKHTQISYEAAAESIVLLKNKNNSLPIITSQKVLVTGPTANSMQCLNGGWSGTWQGNNTDYDNKDKKTILQAIQDKLGAENVIYTQGTSFDKTQNLQAVTKAAEGVETIIVCIGEMSYTETPGNIDDLNLPDAQIELVKTAAATGKKVIVIMAAGRPRIVQELEPNADAFLMSLLPGNEGGRAIADIIVGEINPSGKMPYTYPRYANALMTYDHKGTDLPKYDFSMDNFDPQWEFGYGQSYTKFAYSNLKIINQTLSKDDSIEISVDVKNIGNRAGKEVVQLFITDKVASVTPSVKRLRAFEKINLKVGEVKTITFNLPISDLKFIGIDNQWIIEPGDFEVTISNLKSDFEVIN